VRTRPTDNRISQCGSGPPGTGSSDPCLPTGDGEAMSHSAPLEGRTLFCPSGGPESLVRPWWTTILPCPGDGRYQSPSEPVGGPHSGPRGRAPVVSPYLRQNAHQGWFPRPGRALAARSWWSSEISLVRASSCRSFSASCCRSISTSSLLLLWWLSCGSWSSSSTIHTWPCGLTACLADSSPLRMRRLIVSAETPRHVAASVIFISMANSLRGCMGGHMRGIYAGSRVFVGWRRGRGRGPLTY